MCLQTTRELVGVSQLMQQKSQVTKELLAVLHVPLEQEDLPTA